MRTVGPYQRPTTMISFTDFILLLHGVTGFSFLHLSFLCKSALIVRWWSEDNVSGPRLGMGDGHRCNMLRIYFRIAILL